MNSYMKTGLVLIIIGVGGYWFLNPKDDVVEKVDTPSSPLSATYKIGELSFTLVNGKAEKEIVSGSATKEKVSVFGEPTTGDFDKDGDIDSALLLVHEPGGSGSFFYVALALKEDAGYKTTNAMFIGDRIAPQNINVIDGRAVVNYADRKAGEDFSIRPSIGKSLYVHFDPNTGNIGEFVKDFEGEADPSRMNLMMKEWVWQKTNYNDGKVVSPKKVGAFTLTFTKDGRFSAKTDCNSMSGSYTAKGGAITFGQIATTLMFCEGSEEQIFSKMLGEAVIYTFTSKGELVFDLKYDSGSMIFR